MLSVLKFGEWYQKTNKTEYTNKLTLLAFKIIVILHNTLLATFIKLLKTVSKGPLGIDRRTAVTRSWIAAVRRQSKNAPLTSMLHNVRVFLFKMPFIS
jgi:surface polysaccharide O-acyltransferase-like enzyme